MFFGTERTSTKNQICKQVCQSGINAGKPTLLGKLDQEQLLAFLGAGAVTRDERVHESLEVRTPPAGETITNVPVAIDPLAGELGASGSKTLVQAPLEALKLLIRGVDVVAGPG